MYPSSPSDKTAGCGNLMLAKEEESQEEDKNEEEEKTEDKEE